MARQKPESGESDLEENVVVAATFKILVLGNSSVGKSSLIKYYSDAKKPENMMPTIGWLISYQSLWKVISLYQNDHNRITTSGRI